MPQTMRQKLKKINQRGGVKASIKTTAGTFVPTVDSHLILPRLFENCDRFDTISTNSATGFVFDMHLSPDSTIELRSQTLDENGGPLTQLEAATRSRYVNKGLRLSNCCAKISLVINIHTNTWHKLTYLTHNKLSVTSAEASLEVENQKAMYRASMCGTGVHGVFMPDAITHEIMSPAKFEALVHDMNVRAGVVTAESQTPLAWIIDTAKTQRYDIQVFCMELIGSAGVGGGGFTTFREFYDRTMAAVAITAPDTRFPPDAVAVACKAAAAVLSTFVKSLFWSYDTHGNNIMTNGFLLYLLDFGRVYHILKNEPYIKGLFEKLLKLSGIIPLLARFFGVAADADVIRAAFNAIYDRYNVPDSAIIAGFFTIDPAVPGDIARVRLNIFEILVLFTLIDGMTMFFDFSVDRFQCYDYIHLVFETQSTFKGLGNFLTQCSSTLSGFTMLWSKDNVVRLSSNLDVIAGLLQGALVPCAAMGPARRADTFVLPPPGTPLSPEEVAYLKARDDLMEQEETDRRAAAAAAAAGTTAAGTTATAAAAQDGFTVDPGSQSSVPSPFLQASPFSPFPPPTQNQLRAAVRNQFPPKGVSRQLVNSKTAAAAAATVVAAAAIKDLKNGSIRPGPGGQKTKINAKLRVRRRYAQSRQRTRRRSYRASRTSRTSRTSRRLRRS